MGYGLLRNTKESLCGGGRESSYLDPIAKVMGFN